MEKIIIYQIFTRLFGNRNDSNIPFGTIAENGSAKFNKINKYVLKRVRELGVTHIWLTGIIRHATTTSYSSYGIPDSCSSIVKGKAGSPYAITDYYDVDPDLAMDVDNRMKEFENLVERIHEEGMQVIIDFVPNHVARQYKSVKKPDGVRDLGEDDDSTRGFSPSNNFYYCVGQKFAPTFDVGSYTEYPARATGNDKFDPSPSENDWYETVKLNYGVDYCDAGGRSEHFSPVPDTWYKMRDILMFWAGKHIQGFRCDMAEMVPPAFWSWVTPQIKESHPGLFFIGEVYNPDLYRTYIASGFDYLYDKVGMYDCMRRVMCGVGSTTDITTQWQATNDISRHMLYFLENHDEQRIASRFFARNAEKGLPAFATCLFMRDNPCMLYAGQEYGEPGMDSEGFSGRDGRTTIFDYWSPKTLYEGYAPPCNPIRKNASIRRRYKRIINMAVNSDAVANGEFFDLMYVNANRHPLYAFLRKSDKELLLVVSNFSGASVRANINIPAHAFSYLGIDEGEYEAVDLLNFSLKTRIISLYKEDSVKFPMKGFQTVVFSIKPDGRVVTDNDESGQSSVG